MSDKPCSKICESCPWLTKNHGKSHPDKWYSVKNLRRLWNGLRKGSALGVVCHSSDPQSITYGATSKVKDSVKPRPCAGALLIVGKHLNEMDASMREDGKQLTTYMAAHKLPLTRGGIRVWLGEYVFGAFNNIEDRAADVSLPWDSSQSVKAGTAQEKST